MAGQVDLNFLAEQQRRLLVEMVGLRADLHDGVAGSKDDMNVLTSIVLRLEGTVTRLDQRLDRFAQRLRELEDRPQ